MVIVKSIYRYIFQNVHCSLSFYTDVRRLLVNFTLRVRVRLILWTSAFILGLIILFKCNMQINILKNVVPYKSSITRFIIIYYRLYIFLLISPDVVSINRMTLILKMISQCLWCQTHYHIANKNKNVSFESLDIVLKIVLSNSVWY